ncbi:MAG: transporter substrate-binding domain-containing protein [Lachnospiraceae bacterium]|nr:transporter substrate-binding domain-containing protein [Lachnospiraceae bacterium]
MNRKIIYLVLCVIAAFVLLTSCKRADEPKKVKVPDTLEGFNDKNVTVGIVDGYIYEDIAKRKLPKAEIKHFSTREYAYKALVSGVISGVLDDEPIIRAVTRGTDAVDAIDGYIEPADYAFIFPKNDKCDTIRKRFDSYVELLQGNGATEGLDEKWFGNKTTNKQSMDVSKLPATNGTLEFAFDGENVPFEYMSAGQVVGFEIDILYGFCQKYGYGLKLNQVPFNDMLNGVESGTYDIACSAITVTDERSERFNFSRPCYTGGATICVRTDAVTSSDANESRGVIGHVKSTFIEEDRYILIIKGVLTTILIVFVSVFIGNPLGYIFFILSRRSNIVVRGIVRAIIWFVHVTPAIMIIMLLYYKYYRDLYIGGVLAAIVGFTLAFSNEIYRMVERYSGMIDDGEFEKNYRLWFSKSSEFFNTLMKNYGKEMITDFKSIVVRLIKATAVVGYIAVDDMTRTFDLIRKDSLEITLPLVTTMILYILIIVIVTKLLDRAANRRVKKMDI